MNGKTTVTVWILRFDRLRAKFCQGQNRLFASGQVQTESTGTHDENFLSVVANENEVEPIDNPNQTDHAVSVPTILEVNEEDAEVDVIEELSESAFDAELRPEAQPQMPEQTSAPVSIPENTAGIASILASTTVCLSVVVPSSCTLISILFLLSPIQFRTGSHDPLDASFIASTWVLVCFFEFIIPVFYFVHRESTSHDGTPVSGLIAGFTLSWKSFSRKHIVLVCAFSAGSTTVYSTLLFFGLCPAVLHNNDVWDFMYQSCLAGSS